MNYYNENDAFAASWLRELIKNGFLPVGDVDERSIEDVTPNELAPYTQCHFFAGIGGWPYALQLAGWPEDKPVWSGSVPCQPFSYAGKGEGLNDERHLWPAFFWLIEQCQPPVIFGEQVSAKAALQWWDLVASDLEGANYAAAAADLPAASVGAPHKRNRLFWVAHTESQSRGKGENPAAAKQGKGIRRSCPDGPSQRSPASRLDYPDRQRWQRNKALCSSAKASVPEEVRSGAARTDGQLTPWDRCEWLRCLDGKSRPIEPSIRLLVDGFPGRVATLRGLGNAIVPQLAAEFIKAYVEVTTY